jgi:cytosine/uracil/thiamine/allantoin permease
LLANYARYVCAYGGFGAMIFGAMLINEFLVRREYIKVNYSKGESTMFVTVRKKKVAQPAVERRPRKKVSKTA